MDAGYGAVRVLEGVSLSVPAGETVVLLGTNGNGKTTLMRSIMGQIRPTAGSIRATLDGKAVDFVGLSPERVVELGVVLVPEGRRLFPRSDRGAEPPPRRLPGGGARGAAAQPRALLRALPAPRRAPRPARRQHERRASSRWWRSPAR